MIKTELKQLEKKLMGEIWDKKYSLPYGLRRRGRRHIIIDLKNGSYIGMFLWVYKEDPVLGQHIYRLASSSKDDLCFGRVRKEIFENLYTPRAYGHGFEISFLFEEGKDVFRWVMDNLLEVKSIPDWEYFKVNCKIGLPLRGYYYSYKANDRFEKLTEIRAKVFDEK